MDEQKETSFRDLLIPEGQEVLDGVLGSVSLILLAAKSQEAQAIIGEGMNIVGPGLKVLLSRVSDFFTDLDIAAVKKMEAAGLSQENAVALQRSSIIYALLPALGKGALKKTQP